MSKIYGNTVGVPTPRPDWEQTDEKKASYIKNKPVLGALASKSKVAETDFTSNVNTMINNKVDKVEGKGLSTNDFTDEDKTKLDALILNDDNSVEMSAQVNAANVIGLSDALDTKVDKEDGKGLASNDELVHCVESVDNIQTSGVYNINDDMYVAYGSASATGFGWKGSFAYVQDTPALTFNNQNDTIYRVSWGKNGVAYIHEDWTLVAQTSKQSIMLDTELEVKATGTTTTLRELGVESINNITIYNWAQSYVVIHRDIVAGQIATKEEVSADYYSKDAVDDLLDAKAEEGHTHTVNAADLIGIVPIPKGGTGADNAAGAMTNLGVADYIVEQSTVTVTVDIPIHQVGETTKSYGAKGVDFVWEYRKWHSGKYDAFCQEKSYIDNIELFGQLGTLYRSDAFGIPLPNFDSGNGISYTGHGTLVDDYSGTWLFQYGGGKTNISVVFWSFRSFTATNSRLSLQIHGTYTTE